MDLVECKKKIRRSMASLKKSYTKEELQNKSEAVIRRLEMCDFFQQASCVALYHSLADEVSTIKLLDKWADKKIILLPVVEGENLSLYPYNGLESLEVGAFGIMEPKKKEYSLESETPDLIIVPGVAFDRQCNRLGRGKGFYDRLLSELKATTAGICFDFQLVDSVPVESFDRSLNYIVSESEVIEK